MLHSNLYKYDLILSLQTKRFQEPMVFKLYPTTITLSETCILADIFDIQLWLEKLETSVK